MYASCTECCEFDGTLNVTYLQITPVLNEETRGPHPYYRDAGGPVAVILVYVGINFITR